MPSRCTTNSPPFFRLLLSFRSLLTINRHCHSSKILHFLRLHFSLLNNSLPIILHEIITNEEVILTDERSISILMNTGIYLALIKYDEMKYQPLIDLKLIPMEIFPEKKFLPKSMPFIIYEIKPFVNALSNMIEYMKEDEKTKLICRKYTNSPLRSLSQMSTIKHRGKSTIAPTFSSPDFIQTPLSTSSIIPLSITHDTDIRKYLVTDPQRIQQNSLPFSFRILHQNEQIFPQQTPLKPILFSSIIENNQFNENDLVLFKQHFSSSFPLELKNCIHQLAIEQKLDNPEVRDILIRLNYQLLHHQLHPKDLSKTIRNLQRAAGTPSNPKETSISNLMKILLRIDQLEKFNKLAKQKVQVFNTRITHLARMGILHQQTKLLKKLSQLDLFQSEPNQQAFSQFIHDDLQRIIPKQIPLNSLGMKEIIHQLHINIDRLGIVPALLLIDNLQQIIHSGLLLTLNKTPQLKRYLTQFIEHIQTGRFISVYLQRLIEQMNHSIPINTIKKVLVTNQLNSLLQKAKLISKNENGYENLISILMNLAYQGQLNTYAYLITQDMKIKEKCMFISKDPFAAIDIQTDIDDNNLQSLLLFLHEQSSVASPSGPLPYQYVCDFIQYLRHFAQLGILYEPKLSYILTNLHKAKDQNNITIETFKTILEQIKTIDYISTYHHLNLIEFDQFLNDMIIEGELTLGQGLYILDRLVDLCRREPITTYDITTLLTNLQLEHNRQQPIYLKLIDSFELLAESYSKSLSELHSFEQELQKFMFNPNIKRLPEEVRKRLNDILSFCKKFRNDQLLVEELFGETMNYKFYNKIKEIFQTKNLMNRKQAFTAIVQIHKHFIQISRLRSQILLTDQQLDLILQNVQVRCSKEHKFIEEMMRNMAKLGHLQDQSFVNYLTSHFLSNELLSWNADKCVHSRTWPLTIDLNHSDVRPVLKHLTQLETQDQIDTGTLIEMQNRLNQLARFGKWSSPQIKFLIDQILQSHGKKSFADKDGFQLIQSYRLIVNDLIHAIELEFYLQKLTSEHQISHYYNYHFREFFYRILQNELAIDELSRYRVQLKQIDIEQVKKFIDLLPKELNELFPLTLTDYLLTRLKWDGKLIDKSIRDQLLKYERSGILSQDTFEEIYNNLYRTADISPLVWEEKNNNQLFYDLLERLNDLLNDGLIDLNQSMEIKEQLYLLEDMIESIDLSDIIIIQSRLFNSSNQKEFQMISQELKTFIHQEQFRLSKAQDLISSWHLNEEKGNLNEKKQIIKLLHELAHLNRLYNSSTISVLTRYIRMKQINQVVYRHLIKDLQRFKDRAIIDKQIIECLRAIEARLYKFDYQKRFNEFFIKKLENHLKQIFTTPSRLFEQQFRMDICKKLNELAEMFIQSNTNENSFEEFVTTFDFYMTQIKQGQIRPSKSRYHHGSADTIVPTVSPSLQSLQSI